MTSLQNRMDTAAAALDRALAKRIAFIVDRHRQSHVARKLGVSQPNLSRYIHGTRLPAWLCASLVQNMGINAHWLLSGIGSPDDTQPAMPARSSVPDVVALVQGIRRARQATLSTVKKSGLDDLRQLADQVDASIAAQERLAKALSLVAQKAAEEGTRAVRAMDLNRAQALFDDVEPLARASGDPGLLAQIEHGRGAIAMRRGETEEAVKRFQRALSFRAGLGLALEADEVGQLCDLAVVLGYQGQVQRGIALCQLTESAIEAAGMPEMPAVAFNRGMLHFLACDLRTGFPIMQEAVSRARGHEREMANAFFASAALYVGTRDVEEEILVLRGLKPLRGRDYPTRVRAASLLAFAIMQGEADGIRKSLAVYLRHGHARDESAMKSVTLAKALVDAHTRRSPVVYDKYIKAHEDPIRSTNPGEYELFASHVRAALVAQASNSPRLAHELAAAAKARYAVPRHLMPKPYHLGSYAKALLAFGTSGKRWPGGSGNMGQELAWANLWISQAIEHGFSCFRHLRAASSATPPR